MHTDGIDIAIISKYVELSEDEVAKIIQFLS